MSYSDYGGYCWKNGRRFKEGEDATLDGIVAPEERPLEEKTGFKLDVLVNAYEKHGANYGSEESMKKVDWLTGHPHHAVVGGIEGLAIVGYKQSISIVWDGKAILSYPRDYDPRNPDHEDPAEISGEQDGYKYWARIVKEKPFDITGGVMFKLLTPNGVEFSGVTGYGIGSHWWKEEDGRVFRYPGERMGSDASGGTSWDSESFEEDKKRYNLTEDDANKPIGYWAGIHWPTYEEWEAYVKTWAAKCR